MAVNKMYAEDSMSMVANEERGEISYMRVVNLGLLRIVWESVISIKVSYCTGIIAWDSTYIGFLRSSVLRATLRPGTSATVAILCSQFFKIITRGSLKCLSRQL